MVGLVEHDQIPSRSCQQLLDALGAFERVDAGDQPVVLGKRVALAVGDVAFAAEDLEIQVERLVQFPPPVLDQAGGHDQQRPRQFAPRRQLAKDHGDFDRLAQAIGEFLSFGRDWHQNDAFRPLVHQYWLMLDGILREHPPAGKLWGLFLPLSASLTHASVAPALLSVPKVRY